MHPAILVIDIGGTNVKLELSTPRQLCKFESGSELTAKAMVAKVKDLAAGWIYDVVSIGYPCACRKSNPDILVMQPAQDRTAKNVTDGPNGTRYRRILI